MAVPVPVLIEASPPPIGWQGESVLDIATLVSECLSGSIDVSFITGQVGGPAPSSNVGPWLNGDEWWVWVPGYGYQPSEGGCPIGTVAIWGQAGNDMVPARWLLCDGRPLNIATYPRLFNAIGTTWGVGGNNTFRLPPSGVFFMNAQGFFLEPGVSFNGNPDVPAGGTGGAQQVVIPASALPPLNIQVPFLNPAIIDDGTNVPDTLSGVLGAAYDYPVIDNNGVLVGTNQQPVSVMPPYVGCNFIIKYL
jgi:hypothetical protein